MGKHVDDSAHTHDHAHENGHVHSHTHGHGHAHSHRTAHDATRRAFLSAMIAAAVSGPWAFGQERGQSPAEVAERFRKMSEDYEREGLSAAFKGITTNG